MEQKRKVKSLISKTNNWELWCFSKFLIILSCLLCFWALGLILFPMSFVDAANTASNEVNYQWLEEKKEVLYKLDFVRKTNLSGIVSTVSVDDRWGIDKLYITPIPIVIKKWYSSNNYIWVYMSGKYVNLLWWNGLKISWDNVTIIWWSDFTVNKSNDNVTIMWWNWNKIISTSTSSSVPNVIIWGKSNKVKWNNAVILWWKGNEVYGKDSFILWWEGNTISWSNVGNVIVAWYKVTASQSNIFAFSNDNNWFIPKKSNAFYINVQKWLWINNNAKKWLESRGAVSFWNLPSCTSNCNWLIWMSAGSLKGYSNGGLKGIWNDGDTTVDVVDEQWYCTGDDYLKVQAGEERYRSCWTEADTYNNVVFETKLLTWLDNNCGGVIPAWKNPCVFVCTWGYHYNSGTCKKDCKVPWSESEYRVHGNTIVWYTASGSTCNAEWSACGSLRVSLRCDDGVWKKYKGAANLQYDLDWNLILFQTCGSSPNVSCDKNVYQYTKIIDNWKNLGSCNDYNVNSNNCISVPYYKWRCYINHTLTGTNCTLWEDTSGCKCKPDFRWVDCSNLPENSVWVKTSYKQVAENVDYDKWSPRVNPYIYYKNTIESSNKCTYRCDTWYLYSAKNVDLKIEEWCWSGCKLPWNEDIVNHGTVITWYKADCTESLQMICIEWEWSALTTYLWGQEDIFRVYDSNWNLNFATENCGN